MMCQQCFHFMPKGVCEACNPEAPVPSAATPADHSFEWWGLFIAARANAIQAMTRLGKTDLEIMDQLSFQDVEHMRRIRVSTHGRY